jgi:hypothetical protein
MPTAVSVSNEAIGNTTTRIADRRSRELRERNQRPRIQAAGRETSRPATGRLPASKARPRARSQE